MRFNDPGFDTLKFIVIAVVLMIFVDHFVFGGKRSYIENARQESVAQRMIEAELKDVPPAEPPVRVEPENGTDFFEHVPEAEPEEEVAAPEPDTPEVPAVIVPAEPVPEKLARAPATGTPRIAIIIDDLGMDVKRSRKIVDMKEPLTLAFLPYAPKTKDLAVEGKKNGHSLIIHAPMEASDHNINIGPIGLRSSMDKDTFNKNFGDMLASFEGYEGINNHMGSGLTQDTAAMTHLMQLLKDHNLFFVDSKTIGTSVAAHKAKEAGVPYAERDVFLDHVDDLNHVRAALKQTENKALKNGTAIAIGHPRDATIKALEEWLPTLKAKGIVIVPVKDLLVRPQQPTPVVQPYVTPEPVVVPEPVPAPVVPEAEVLPPTVDDGSTVSVTLPDGTEQQIHLPPQ